MKINARANGFTFDILSGRPCRLLGFFSRGHFFCFPEVCRAQSSFSRVFVLTPGRKYDCKLREIQLENGVLKKWTNWWGSWVCSGCDLGWLARVVGVSGASPHGAESNGVWCMGGCDPFFILKSCFEHGKLLGNKKSERERKNQAAYRRLGANVLL